MSLTEEKEEEKLPVQPCEPATNTLAKKRKEQLITNVFASRADNAS